MEDSLAAYLFAEQLTHYIVRENKNGSYLMDIPGEIHTKPEPPYHAEIQFAIRSLIQIKIKDIRDCFTEIVMKEMLPREEYYSRFALQALPLYFPDGYTPETFIAYCAMVIGVGHCLQFCEDREVLRYASGAVSTALTGFMLSNEFQEQGGFDGLRDTCKKFNSATAKLKLDSKKKELQRTKQGGGEGA